MGRTLSNAHFEGVVRRKEPTKRSEEWAGASKKPREESASRRRESQRTALPVGFSPKEVCSDVVWRVLEEWWVPAPLQRLRREREWGGHGLSEQGE